VVAKMSAQNNLIIDENGKIQFPEDVLQRLGWKPGTTLKVEIVDDIGMWLQLIPETPPLIDEGGVLVVDCELLGDIEDIVELVREERMVQIAGGQK
jgi:bifunctional DNA-binding transcriptional regulator/antitoxin component of YhaV-PrlF toxin-antitoxin module